MKPEDDIVKQLKEQNIEFNILQEEYNPDKESLVSKTIQKWKKKFIAEGWIDREGEFKMNWSEREFGKDKVKKRCPVKVKCGSRETLLNLANYILAQYGEDLEGQGKDEDISF